MIRDRRATRATPGAKGDPGPKGDKGDKGEKGDDGAAGTGEVTGYEVLTQHWDIGAGIELGSFAGKRCPPGKVVVGGGGDVFNTDGQGNPRPDLTASYPTNNGWAVRVQPSDGGTFAYPVSLGDLHDLRERNAAGRCLNRERPRPSVAGPLSALLDRQ